MVTARPPHTSIQSRQPGLRLRCWLLVGQSARIGFLVRFVLLFAASLPVALPEARAQETARLATLYSFNGEQPSPLIPVGDGSFYGATFPSSGSNSNRGQVFKVTPAGIVSTIYSATGGNDASYLVNLSLGNDGNLYGTTLGTVFRLLPTTGELTTLRTFSGPDGRQPNQLVQGSDGNFYGTTITGGSTYSDERYGPGEGTVYRLTPAGDVTILHNFTGGDGAGPSGALVQGGDGNFYGVTSFRGSSVGGASQNGTVFRITPAGDLTTLYRFNGSDGSNAQAGLEPGRDGNFYGVTYSGGSSNKGTVFRITPGGVLTTLHSFVGSDGANPQTKLLQGADGNFYGTTLFLEADSPSSGMTGGGTLYQITPEGVLTTLYIFPFSTSAGSLEPNALAGGSGGIFYGTAHEGVNSYGGSIFKLAAYPAFFEGEIPVSDSVNYLVLPNGNLFGYYSFLDDPRYFFHIDLGYEFVFDANDGKGGVYLYDFASDGFFYTSPAFPFPYLYDFQLQAVLYYYPDTINAGRYTTNPRTFYNFATGQIIAK